MNRRMTATFVFAFLSFLIPKTEAQVVNFGCDRVIVNLLRVRGACPEGTCPFSVIAGRLKKAPGSSSDALKFETLKFELDGNYSLMTEDAATLKSSKEPRMKSARVDISKNGEMTLAMTVAMTTGQRDGRIEKQEYVFGSNAVGCPLKESSRKGFDEDKQLVNYDQEFCRQAVAAFHEWPREKLKACEDVIGKIVDLYAKRADALKGKNKFFSNQEREGALSRPLRAMGLDSPTQSLATLAIAQRDRCLQVETEISLASRGSFTQNFALNSDREILEKRTTRKNTNP